MDFLKIDCVIWMVLENRECVCVFPAAQLFLFIRDVNMKCIGEGAMDSIFLLFLGRFSYPQRIGLYVW